MNFAQKRAACALIFLATAAGLGAQSADWCATGAPPQEWENEIQKLIAERQSNASGKISTQPYVIPVIVHIIHSGESVGQYPNLAAAQVLSQIHVLNQDLGGVGYNSGNYPATAYATWASTQTSMNQNSIDGLGRVKIANCNVQFCLAMYDTLGNPLPEPGIDRINHFSRGWQNPGNITSYSAFKNFIDNTVKPQTIWNVKKYFNIWVTDEMIGNIGLLGYATFPVQSTLLGMTSVGSYTTDGIFVYARAFGSVATYPNGSYTSSNNRGRTCTHEVGHWLGLRHIWGDANCGNDFCADTPPATASNFGSPSYPLKVGQCSANAPNGEMFMNFMDYVDDPVKYMFTEDQALRVQTAMANSPYRKFLGTHNLCSVQSMPATSQFNLMTSVCGTETPVNLANMSTGIPVPSFTWSSSGGVIFLPHPNSSYATANFPAPGVYTITLSSSNGTLSNSSRTINVIARPNLQFSSPSTTVCVNDVVNLVASGGNSYMWYPGGQGGPVVTYVATSDITYTCIAFGTMNCNKTDTISFRVDACTGLSKFSGRGKTQVYPNPTNGTVHLISADQDGEADLRITDALGRDVLNRKIDLSKGDNQVETSSLPAGIYTMTLFRNGEIEVLKLVKEQ